MKDVWFEVMKGEEWARMLDKELGAPKICVQEAKMRLKGKWVVIRCVAFSGCTLVSKHKSKKAAMKRKRIEERRWERIKRIVNEGSFDRIRKVKMINWLERVL